MPRSSKSKNLNKVYIAITVLFFVILGIITYKAWKYFTIGVQVVTSDKIELKQDEEKNINVLILGAGGGNHEGPDLTDTIIFANIDPKTKRIVLASIPRDLWVPDLSAKINTAYLYGEQKEKGSGLTLAKAVAGKIVGQKIDYAVKIDFRGFVKAVDLIGGLDVEVARTFDDYAYPVKGLENELCGRPEEEIASLSAQIATGSATEFEFFPCRFEHLHFDEGTLPMDGETALKFVRSRHALGPEGSDFARSKRQENVIKAFKDKIFSLELLLNPVKAINLFNVVKDSVATDIKEGEYDDFIRLAQKMQDAQISSGVIDTGDYSTERIGLLTIPDSREGYGGQWVLIPASGNGEFSEIHDYIKCQIDKSSCSVSPTVIAEES